MHAMNSVYGCSS